MDMDPFDGVTTDLTPSERLALVYIRLRGPVRQVELIDQNVLSGGSVTHAIDGLLEAGHIRRTHRVGDDLRRSPYVFDPAWHDNPNEHELQAP